MSRTAIASSDADPERRRHGGAAPVDARLASAADPTIAVAAWRLTAPDSSESLIAWRDLAAAIVCWPGPPIAVERRIGRLGARGRLDEYLLVRVSGAGVVAPATALLDDLSALLEPLRRARGARPVAPARRSALLEAAWVRDAAELDRVADLPVEALPVLAERLDALLAGLSGLSGPVAFSVVAAPGPSEEEDEADPAALRLRVRLAAGSVLPPSVLARAGAFLPGPAGGPTAWWRAHTPTEVSRAGDALAVLDDAALHGGLEGEDGRASAMTAALIAAAPARADRVRISSSILRPVERVPYRDGPRIGWAPSAASTARRLAVRLPWAARRHHLFVAGATGTGKSSLLSLLLADDLRSDRAVVVLDPHRDLAELALGLVPEHRRGDVILIDPTGPEGTAAIDLLPDREADPNQVASRLRDAFVEMFDPHGRREWIGPAFQRAVTNAVHALFASEAAVDPPSLSGVERTMTDPDFVDQLAAGLPPERRPLALQLRSDAQRLRSPGPYNDTGYYTSKLTALLASPAASLFSAPADYRFDEALARRKIVICCLPVGELGFEVVELVGRLIVSRLLGALTAQGLRRPDERAPVSLVFDEAQLVAGGRAIDRLLSQGRKFGAAVTLANQAPSHLEDALPAVLTNCATLALFRLPSSETRWFTDRCGEEVVAKLSRMPVHHLTLVHPDSDGLPAALAMHGDPPPTLASHDAAATRAAALSAHHVRGAGGVPTQATPPEPESEHTEADQLQALLRRMAAVRSKLAPDGAPAARATATQSSVDERTLARLYVHERLAAGKDPGLSVELDGESRRCLAELDGAISEAERRRLATLLLDDNQERVTRFVLRRLRQLGR